MTTVLNKLNTGAGGSSLFRDVDWVLAPMPYAAHRLCTIGTPAGYIFAGEGQECPSYEEAGDDRQGVYPTLEAKY